MVNEGGSCIEFLGQLQDAHTHSGQPLNTRGYDVGQIDHLNYNWQPHKRSGDAEIQIGDNVTPLTNRRVYSQGSVLGLPHTEVISTAASVGLIARMVDVETGSVLWSARMTYEGFDADSAMSTITASFVKSLIPIWPNINSYR